LERRQHNRFVIQPFEDTGMRLPISLLAIAIALTWPLASPAQSGHTGHHTGAALAQADTAMTNGVVRRVDKSTGSVTIAHEALTNLDMPKMTMTFAVKDRTWLDGLKEGMPIRFVADNVNGTLTVVALERAK
jgi:Cu(I)/Ag(I) efflux system periplasmic protein CusF